MALTFEFFSFLINLWHFHLRNCDFFSMNITLSLSSVFFFLSTSSLIYHRNQHTHTCLNLHAGCYSPPRHSSLLQHQGKFTPSLSNKAHANSFSLCVLWTPGFHSFLLQGKLTRRKKRQEGHDRDSWSGWLMASPHPNASLCIHITPLVHIHLYGNAAASTAGILQKRCPLLIVIILADCSSDRPCKTSISHLYGNAPL